MDDDLPTDDELVGLTGLERKSATSEAEDMLEEALVPAVQSVIDLATSSDKDNIRLQAATYIIDRKLGRISSGKLPGDWAKLLEEIEEKADGKNA